uniref:Uncharacterized protein n=1 Tax=uncultured marine group II/III euryarchaeote AD1000_88_G11 TaxID=1457822 RepID=A0A075FYY5_9EURY|nr:hypothetical protein [uncultured marine group II/III euryarchaeote AD1000_88_G11]
MGFSFGEKQQILQSFPNIRIPFERKVNRKVANCDMFSIIPKGLKYFAWFCRYKTKCVCFFLKLFKKKQIQNITIKECSFHHELTAGKGTILYGTMFVKSQTNFFSIEDIFYFKGYNLEKHLFNRKLSIIEKLFRSFLNSINLNSNSILFGLPLFKKTYKEVENIINTVPYTPYCIQARSFQQRLLYNFHIKVKKTQSFYIKAKLKSDIYELYDNEDRFIDYAYIRDYKTSVLMNSLFRNIKENRNLDLIEESDDEEDFEDIDDTRYVDLKKKLEMECIYNLRFKKWTPIRKI